MKKIAIIDFGGQYTHLIARRIRNLNVFSEIFHPEDFKYDDSIAGIILSGGPHSTTAQDAYRFDYDIKKSCVPILGICYGHQLLAKVVGGSIRSHKNTEYGRTEVQVDPASILFEHMNKVQTVWMSHGDYVHSIPDGFWVTSSSKTIPIASFESKDKRLFGVQFHPEVSHTDHGSRMLDHFINVCVTERNWDSKQYKQTIIQEIRERAHGKKLIVLLSGGVDSLVSLELCLQAVGGESIYTFHIDTGFMRKNESKELAAHFQDLNYQNLEIVNAEEKFLQALANITDPEQKRLIIGKLFVEIIHEKLKNIDTKGNWLLVQGTIYPDTIESGSSKKSAKIKTHHNRVEEIEKLMQQGKVIEPLRDLYKDEVRSLGMELGLPKHLIKRHPFPGPGLAIRILCNTKEIDPTPKIENSILDKIVRKKHYDTTILPIRSVGVQGDYRTYEHPAVIWTTQEQWNWKVIRSLASQMINSVSQVNRVMLSLQPVTNFTLQKLWLRKDKLNHLREIDAFFRKKTACFSEIWQMPVVQLPIAVQNKLCYVIRPICSIDAMTADFFEMDELYLSDIIDEAKKRFEIGEIFYDVTSKPPGTIEWE